MKRHDKTLAEQIHEMLQQAAVRSGWVTYSTAADSYKVTERTIRRWVKHGNVRSRQGNTHLEVNLDSIDQHLDLIRIRRVMKSDNKP